MNASNLVPQGIKGMSIEDVITGLYESAGRNLKKAEKGIIFLDEFDKLNDSDLDLKEPVKNILLTFTAGGNFPIDNDRYKFDFNSSRTTKICAGVFDRITEKVKSLGFNSTPEGNEKLGSAEEIRKKIIEKEYFTQEELTRISTILAYNELPLVSIDYNGNSASSTIDGLSTMVMEGRMAKVVSWYDNEIGYSTRLMDLALYIASKGLEEA